MTINVKIWKIISVWLKVFAIAGLSILFHCQDNLELVIFIPFFNKTIFAGSLAGSSYILYLPIIIIIGLLIVDGIEAGQNKPWYTLFSSIFASGFLLLSFKMCYWFFDSKNGELFIGNFLKVRRIWNFEEKWDFLNNKKDQLISDYLPETQQFIKKSLENYNIDLRDMVGKLSTKKEVEGAIENVIKECVIQYKNITEQVKNNTVITSNNSSGNFSNHSYEIVKIIIIVCGVAVTLYFVYNKWEDFKNFFFGDSAKQAAEVSKTGMETSAKAVEATAESTQQIAEVAGIIKKGELNVVSHADITANLSNKIGELTDKVTKFSKMTLDITTETAKENGILKESLKEMNLKLTASILKTEHLETVVVNFLKARQATGEILAKYITEETDTATQLTVLKKSVSYLVNCDLIKGGMMLGVKSILKKPHDWGTGNVLGNN